MVIKIDRKEALKTAGYLGAGLLIVGYIRYSVQDVAGMFTGGLMIGGGVLLIVSIIANFKAIRAAFGGRSAKLGANTTVMGVAVIAILAVINFLSYKHHSRIDVTSEKLYSLSDQTRKVASGLQKEVKVMKFDTSFNESDDQTLRDLITEYRNLGDRITFEELDPQAKPELNALVQKYGAAKGDVIVASGERSENVRDVSEQGLTNAILKVTRDRLKKVCFVEGHGEKKLSSRESDGYSVVDVALKNENYETSTVNLVSSNEVPSDCDVLVLAGPKQSLFPQETAAIGKYLDAGGKTGLFLDPDTYPKVEDVLSTWNIKLGSDTVVDFSGVGRLFGIGPGAPLVRTYDAHAITKDFENTMTFFPLSRSVTSESGGAGAASVTDLLKTSAQSWAETELKGNEVTFDEGKDRKGPISIGVAAEKTVGDKDARLVVIGDSDFAANNFFGEQRNGDLFVNTINWLAQDEDLISIRPKSATQRTVTMTESEQSFLFWLTIMLLPGAVVGSGIYIWWKRR